VGRLVQSLIEKVSEREPVDEDPSLLFGWYFFREITLTQAKQKGV
jgi:hypothetical protein